MPHHILRYNLFYAVMIPDTPQETVEEVGTAAWCNPVDLTLILTASEP
jgi:hypothetical protein